MLIKKNTKKIINCCFIFLCFFFYVNPLYAATSKIKSLNITNEKQSTQILLKLTQKEKYKIFALQNPNRLVLDLNNSQLTTDINQLNLSQSLIQKIRSAPHQKALRIVFDLRTKVKFKDYFISLTKDNVRLVIDLKAQKSSLNLTLSSKEKHIEKEELGTRKNNSVMLKKKSFWGSSEKEEKKIASQQQSLREKVNADANTANTKEKIALEDENTIVDSSQSMVTRTADSKSMHEYSNLNHREIVVVIDPGHGGKDPGATGPHGIHEKDVVLSIAKDLQLKLNQINGIHAVLTRDKDYFISLRGRLNIARKAKADLFIAIHADAYRKTNSEGASVYALSERGASSEAAHWLAQRENYSELGGVEDFSEKSRLVRSVLLDLSQTVTIAQSLQIGSTLLSSLQQLTPLHYDVVEQARFVVLKSPDIPSLLVETGFITNPIEEKRLDSPNYQAKLAEALSHGIERYFWYNPPADSYLMARRDNA